MTSKLGSVKINLKNRGVTLHIFAVIKLKCAVIKPKLGRVKINLKNE